MKRWPIIIYILCEAVLFFQLWQWEETAFAQLLVLSQLPIVLLLKPFVFRGETKIGGTSTKSSKIVLGILSALLIAPFLLVAQVSKHEPSMIKTGHGLFLEGHEGLLVLGFCLASVFVMSVLIQRRGIHRWK